MTILPSAAPAGPQPTPGPAAPSRKEPAASAGAAGEPGAGRAAAVLANRPFLLLWLSQAATQIGGNMVVYGLTVVVFSVTRSNAAVSLLLLTFLVPGVLFSALAGVYVDRLDRRHILIATNLLRAGAFGLMLAAGENILAIYVLNALVSTVTTLFAPAEAAMIPTLVPRHQLIAANGLFTITLNGAFALGFALLGPLTVTLAGPEALLGLVAALYLVAAAFCVTLPASPPVAARLSALEAVGDVERAVGTTFRQLADGLGYIAAHPSVTWSLVYLGIGAALIGVLGVLGPAFATQSLGLDPKDFVVVVLPLGLGLVSGIVLLNRYGKHVVRRRLIEAGLLALGLLLGVLSVAGTVTRLAQRVGSLASPLDVSTFISMLSVVVGIAFLAGVAYAFVLVPSQTQLQEELSEDVRGRVFGVLNTLVSVASFVPIIVAGPIADLVGTRAVILAIGVVVFASGLLSIATRRQVPIRRPVPGADRGGGDRRGGARP